jgi:hypothetical protein
MVTNGGLSTVIRWTTNCRESLARNLSMETMMSFNNLRSFPRLTNGDVFFHIDLNRVYRNLILKK